VLIVQKYGGTSVANTDRIQAVARRVAESHHDGNALAVIVSAMAGQTDYLLGLAKQLTPTPAEREIDVLAATGEQVTSALLAIELNRIGVPALSFLGHQVRIRTDSAYRKARIREIDARALKAAHEKGQVAVIAGFQGVDAEGNITTLGRGGSDTTAVAVAAAIGADLCEIYTDVTGVFTADPRICPDARKLDRISYEVMLELASVGAKVLQIRSVAMALRYRVNLCVRSSFNDEPGTLIVPEDEGMEGILVAAVAHDRNEAKIAMRRVPDHPGIAATIFRPLAEANISVDVIIQNVSAEGHTDLTFTVPVDDFETAMGLVTQVAEKIGGGDVEGDKSIAKVSIVGVGMRSHSGVAARMFDALAEAGINIQMISTSEIKVSCVIEEKYTELAVRVLHEAFELADENGGWKVPA
jgi:aspartate kinase